jgi:protein-S-isoprenylcysteine O-methyltransferase Ste14
MPRLGRFLFRYRNGLFPLVFLFAFLAGQPRHALGRADADLLLDILGAVIALGGQGLRIVTIGYEYIVRGGKDRQVYADRLVLGGIFAHGRNPLYLGNLLMIIGAALILHSWAFYFIFLPFIFFAYAAIVRAEENYLSQKFGSEYGQYCSKVNRWWPRWSGLRQSTGDMRFNWRRVVIKEYNTTFLLITALAGLKLWSDFVIEGPVSLPNGVTLSIAAAVWLGFYLIVRTLKKSEYIRG